MPTYTETDFENHIEAQLKQSGYRSLPLADYDKDLCLIPHEVLQFIQATQPKEYQKLRRQYGADTPEKLLDRISKVIERRWGARGTAATALKTGGVPLKLTYFRPSSGLNPDHRENYTQNRFALIRQLKYSGRNEKSLDMVLFLNGLPLVTMELKNSLTGQVVTDAEKQYKSIGTRVSRCSDSSGVWFTLQWGTKRSQ